MGGTLPSISVLAYLKGPNLHNLDVCVYMMKTLSVGAYVCAFLCLCA